MERIGDAVTWLFSLLWPPSNENPKLNRWQRHMAGSMIVVTVAVAGLALAATGKLEEYGVGGFASSDDMKRIELNVTDIKQSQNALWADITEGNIIVARKEQCKAMERDDTASKPATLRRLEELRTRYRLLTGVEYRLLGCDEL